MKKLLLALLVLASPLAAKERDFTLYPPNVPAPRVIEADPPQTNTFCASNLPCTVTGAWTFSNSLAVSGVATFTQFEDVLFAGPGGYSTIAAAVTAAGVSNKTLIWIRSNYPTTECGVTQANIQYWDFRGGVTICGNNSISFNSADASGVNAMQRWQHALTGTTLVAPGGPLALYSELYLNNTNFNGSLAEGFNADVNFFGANTNTLALAAGAEFQSALFGTVPGPASTGGTITKFVGIYPHVTTAAGSTTAITQAAGVYSRGCGPVGSLAGTIPAECYGGYFSTQAGLGVAKAYSIASEGMSLFKWDFTGGVSKGGFDCEDITNTARPCFFIDGTGVLNIQAVTGTNNGLRLATSDGSVKIRMDQTNGIIICPAGCGSVVLFGNDIKPQVAAGAALGAAALPFNALSLGTGANLSYNFTPLAPAGSRTINIADPLQATTTLPLVIANGTKALNTASITTATCDAGAAATATGTLSTDAVDWSFNAAPTATNKYGAFLVVYAVPSANTVTFYTCNPSATTSTPTAMTVNWSVRRP